MNHSILVLALPLLLGACTVSSSPPTIAAEPVPAPPQRPPPEPQPPLPRQQAVLPAPPPPPQGQIQTMSFSMAYGRPQTLRPGAEVGFWIWSVRRGQWQVRTTSQMQPHRFQGRVVSESALFDEVGATRLEWSDRIRPSPNAIDFDFVTQGDEDGFDFRTSGDGCLRFELSIDGQAASGHAMIGAYSVRTRASSFRLCP